tara:strand:- start:22036 stop:23580 length:1545 start_codon:yes stop_codon:yes gene_type:complete
MNEKEEYNLELYENENENDYIDSIETNAGVFSEALPQIVREFQQSALEVSHYNHIPAAISFFTILGQITKDFISIPNGRSIEDSRIHFCWVQTSGTGKSTLWNFVGPVSKRTFQLINDEGNHPSLKTNSTNPNVDSEMERVFNTFGVTDYTDSVLIGGWGEKKVMETNTETLESKWTGDMEIKRKPGLLEGNGLAHWDEFEYSGIFKQSQHQDKAIVYLNTLMNTLAGESWIISKALASYEDGQIMECFCERSIIAMTYPPSNLNEIMAEKGVLQRMLLYVWEVPKFIQHKMRLEQIDKAGTLEEVDQPIDKYANALFKIYKEVEARFNSVGGNALNTIKYSPDFNEVLKLEYQNMNNYLWNTRGEVADIASNFTTRLLKILIKMSVLCSVASAPSITKEEEKFLVTGHNVRQAATIVRQCYMTLVDWLERSLRVKRHSISENSLESVFINVYNNMEKDEEGFVNKTKYIQEIKQTAKKSQAQVYRHFDNVKHQFEDIYIGRSKYIRMIKGDEA